MVDLPPELSKLRGRLLKKKSELPFQQQKEAKFKYLQKAPLIQLVVANQVQASGWTKEKAKFLLVLKANF